MPMCKFCGVKFDWGNDGEKWVPLIPLGADDGFDRAFQDEDGKLRAAHALICNRGASAVRISRLAKKVPGNEVLPSPKFTEPDEDGVCEPIGNAR